MTDLSYLELVSLKTKAAMNFSMKEIGVRSLDDCGVDFENMRTLSCELKMRKLNPLHGVSMDSDKLDSDELKVVYVIPLTLPNGQEVTAIVDNSGRSMAVELKDEEGKSANFILSDRLKQEIAKNPKLIQSVLTSEGLGKHLGLDKQFMPENLDELSEKIADRKLIPTLEEVEEQGNIQKEDYDPEKVKEKKLTPKAEEVVAEEEVDLDQIAKEAGVSKDALEKFMEAEGITDKNQIKGIKPVTDIDGLESMIGHKLPEQDSTVLVLRTKGVANKDRGYIIDTDGNKLLGNTDKVNSMAEEIVPDHSCSEPIKDFSDEETDIQTIEYQDSQGNAQKQQLDPREGNTEIDMVKYAQNKLDYLKMERDSALKSLNSGEFNDQAEYLTRIAEIQDNYKMGVNDLQAETGVNLDDISRDAEETAEAAYTKAGVQEVKDDLKGITGAAVATAGAIAGIAAGVNNITGRNNQKEDDDRDPREQHGNSHENGRIPNWLQ